MNPRRLARQQKKTSSFKPKFLRWSLLCLLALAIFYFLLPSRWDRANSISIAIAGDNEVALAIFDPDLEKISVIRIPGNTQVTASNQLGTWKLGSIWQLGRQENLGGELLSSTLMKSFGVPIDAWAAKEGQSLFAKNHLKKFKTIFIPFATNLTLKDKIKLTLFSLQNSSHQFYFDLAETSFLQKTRLTSGEEGYLIRPQAPPEILHLFADPKIIQESPRIGLINATGSKLSSSEIAQLIHALGSRISFLEDAEALDTDCSLAAPKSSHTAQRLASILHCQRSSDSTNNLDLTLTIGTDFAKRF